MFENLTSTKKLNQWIIDSLAECKASYPLPPGENNIAVDIGANVGGFCLHACKHFKKIYAFEPLVENFLILEEVLNHYNIQNVEVYNTAIYSESNKILPLKIFAENHSKDVTCAQFDSDKLIGTNKTCETISLKDMFEALDLDHVDYLKLDCEGSEYEILENFDDYNKISFICMEIHTFFGDQRKLDLLKKLKQYYHFLSLEENGIFSLNQLLNKTNQNISHYTNKSNVFFINKNLTKDANVT